MGKSSIKTFLLAVLFLVGVAFLNSSGNFVSAGEGGDNLSSEVLFAPMRDTKQRLLPLEEETQVADSLTTSAATVVSSLTTATGLLDDDMYPVFEAEDFSLTRQEQGQFILEGEVSSCSSAPDLVLYYFRLDEKFVEGTTRVEIPITCGLDIASVYEVILDPNSLDRDLELAVGVRSSFQDFGFVSVSSVSAGEGGFPGLPSDSGSGRRIVYSNAEQRVWLVEGNGVVRDSYLVSGKKGTPAVGTYSVFSKSEQAFAGHDGITMDNMVRFVRPSVPGDLSIGFHGIPVFADGTPLQADDDLGEYQSAGCVRQNADKSEQLYEWAVSEEEVDAGRAGTATAVVVLP